MIFLSLTLDDVHLVYDGLVIDTQGSELLVLRGASSCLSEFKYIKCEAADFEMYRGAATTQDSIDFLVPRGFELARNEVFARKANGRGEVADLLFKRRTGKMRRRSTWASFSQACSFDRVIVDCRTRARPA
jgi:hypothetical protein